MAANKRTPQQRERDKETVARMYCQSYTQREIAKKIGVSIPQVCFILQGLHADWRISAAKDIELRKIEESERLMRIENAAWIGYERSILDAEKTTTKKKLSANKPKQRQGAANGPQTVANRLRVVEQTTISNTQAGDPRFLSIALECIARRCAIWGVDDPLKIAPTTPDGKGSWDPEKKKKFVSVMQQRYPEMFQPTNGHAEHTEPGMN